MFNLLQARMQIISLNKHVRTNKELKLNSLLSNVL